MAQDDVINIPFAQAGPLDESAQRGGGQVGGGERGQGPAHPTDRGPDGIADHDIHASTVGRSGDILKYSNRHH
ncbi:hypothetical protein MMUR_35610 [Mycolicibacterium murale]|uniref:Uncharacterized protein n=1 Tax=Mycolicibacterium murale TaxID=182220 RepID=A0A7I9WNV3_9MYCO|nr:hypothetical protein MMUR_35610 [Mycolicibacterium murale]